MTFSDSTNTVLKLNYIYFFAFTFFGQADMSKKCNFQAQNLNIHEKSWILSDFFIIYALVKV